MKYMNTGYILIKMEEICKKFKITQLKDKYCLDDIASNIIESRNKAMYFFKIEEKEKIGKKYYVSKERFKTILKYAKSSNAKKAFDMLTDEKQNKNNKKDVVDENDEELEDNRLFKGYFIKYETINVHVVIVSDVYWFRGKDVCEILKYEKDRDALAKNVSDENKCQLKELFPKGAISNGALSNKEIYEQIGLEKNVQGALMYINYSGLYELCLSSRKPKAGIFRKWLTNEVIPSIDKTGTYTLPKNKEIPLPYLAKYEVDINDHINAKCIYIIYIKENLFKFGISAGMVRRMTDHIKSYDCEKIIKIIQMSTKDECKYIEDKIKNFCKQHKILCTVDRQKEVLGDKYVAKSIEMFAVTKEITIDNVIDKIDEYVSEHEKEKYEQEQSIKWNNNENPYEGITDIETIKVISNERLKVKQIELECHKEIKIRELELKHELEKLKIQNDSNSKTNTITFMSTIRRTLFAP